MSISRIPIGLPIATHCNASMGKGVRISIYTPPLPIGSNPTIEGQPAENKDFKAPLEVVPGQTRILLSEAASKHLLEAGEAFTIISRSWHPDTPGRMVIHVVPVPLRLAQDAASVLCGKSRAVKIKATTSKP